MDDFCNGFARAAARQLNFFPVSEALERIFPLFEKNGKNSMELPPSYLVLLVQLHATANAAYVEAAPVLETADMTETLTLEAYAKRYQREALKLLNAYRRAPSCC